MKYFAIVSTDVTDPSWIQEYIDRVTPMLSRRGARYLTRTDRIELIEGENKPQFQVVTEFPSREAALEFYNSEEYAPFKTARLRGARSTFLLLPVENGTELAG